MLRAASLEDYLRYRDWAGRPETTRFWPPRAGEWTDAQLAAQYDGEIASPSTVLWTIAYSECPVGLAWLLQIDWIRRQGELVIMIGEHELHGRGIATEARRLQIEYAFMQLNFNRLFSRSIDANVAIQRADERLGFRRIGTAPDHFRVGDQHYAESVFELLRGDRVE